MPPKKAATVPLSEDSKYIVESMNTKFDKLSGDLQEMRELLEIKSAKVEEMESEITLLKNKVTKLENSLDDEDSYVRRDTIIFHGTSIPPCETGEICSDVICNVIKNKLKINLQSSEISVAHRNGKIPTNQGPDRRGIIIKFCRRDTKRTIMMTKRDNSDGNHTLFSNESLTSKRQTILYALRQMKKKFPNLVKGCTSQDGRVFAFTSPPAMATNARMRDRKHLINTHESLVQFCREYVKLPLDIFLDSWNH